MAVSDWQRVPKSDPKYNQRWYVNKKTGERISRSKFQQIQNSGLSARELAEIRRQQNVNPKRIAAQKRFNAIVKKFKYVQSQKLGIPESKVRVRGNSETAKLFKQQMAVIKKEMSKKEIDRSPDGTLAKALVELGFRKKEWDMPVGES